MSFKPILFFAVVLLLSSSLGVVAIMAQTGLKDGLYAEFNTTKGTIICELYYKNVPMTVTNFVALAEGKMETKERTGLKFFDGLTFHRVIPNFMIQGGCPLGTGTGNPGYRFPDEIDPTLKHDSPGVLSMANSGPNTNGSQFFITHVPTPWLDGKHAVFGRVVQGQDVVNAIVKDDVLNSVKILRVGKEATAFKADQASFNLFLSKAEDKTKAAEKVTNEKFQVSDKEEQALIKQKWPTAASTPTGLKYVVTKEGSGDKPTKGMDVTAHYTGTLMDGKKFDSSVDRGQPFTFKVGQGQVIKGWDEAFLDMKKGEKRTLIIPFQLAYGQAGRPPVIPPLATLIFDVELIDFK